jgi:large subunit ribosomal protein L34
MLRMSTKDGRNVLKRRRLKGRHMLTVSDQRTGKAQKKGLVRF